MQIKKRLVAVLLMLMFSICNQKIYAWGKTGHELVAEIAFYFLDDSTKALIKNYLGNLSIEKAANWMDDSRSNSYYEYMKTWHYLDIDKGLQYMPSAGKNILTVLHSAIAELRKYKTIKRKDVKRNLLLIFHLTGDLHQPLHTGYHIDKGGNSIQINSQYFSGNLHSVWDTRILEYKNIKLDSCLEFYKTLDSAAIAEATKINELKWMYESRSYLDTVYSFKNNFLDKNYIDNNAVIIKKQLVMAGLRLAAILKDAFKR
jgi:S1/P1 Nuclease